jgi:hypothetical protein
LEKRKLAHPMISISDYTKAIAPQGDGEAPLQTVTMQQLPAFIIKDDKLTVILGAIKDDFPIDYAILASNDALIYAMAVEHVRQKCQLDDVANPIDHLKSVQGKHHCSLHGECSHDTKDCHALKKCKQKKPLGFAGVLQDISLSSLSPSLSLLLWVKANLSLSLLKIKGRAFPVLNPPC